MPESTRTPKSFFCTCTRKQLEEFAVYPGRCRSNKTPTKSASTRILVGKNKIAFHDLILGSQEHDLGVEYGDFIIQRKDGLTAYNLATAVDDAAEITHVVRGQDLYTTTAVQIHLMQLLGLSPPIYAHIPVLTFADGKKLSKQNLAPALNNTIAADNLRNAFNYLGMHMPANDEVDSSKNSGLGDSQLGSKKIANTTPAIFGNDIARLCKLRPMSNLKPQKSRKCAPKWVKNLTLGATRCRGFATICA